jgi:hypothetical protein
LALSFDEYFLRPRSRDGDESDPEDEYDEYELELLSPLLLPPLRFALLFLRRSAEYELYEDV